MSTCDGLLRQRVDNKDLLLFGLTLDSFSGTIVEMYHATGYDGLLIDREHSALNLETISEYIRLARVLGLPCMVRVAENCYHQLNPILDQAPDGIFVPRIRSRDEVEELIQTVKYPPEGVRGLASIIVPVSKTLGWGSAAEQIETVNRNLVIGIQIETAEALADVDNIVSVPGVDIALVGPDDLSLALGIPGQYDDAKYVDAVKRIIEACQKHNVLPGTACLDPVKAHSWIELGMKMIWYAVDSFLLWQAGRRQIEALKELLGEGSD